MAISKVYLKGATHYQAVVWKHGKRIASKSFRLKTDAKSWLNQQGDLTFIKKNQNRVTLEEFWELHYYPNLVFNPKTLLEYKGIWLNHVRPILGSTRLSDIGPEMYERMIKLALEKGCSNARANRVRAVLSSILTKAEARGLIRNPIRGMPLLREDLLARKIWSTSDAHGFLTWLLVNESYWFPFYLTAYETGMRFSEIVALHWDAVDLPHGKLTVTRVYCPITKTFMNSTKSKKQRTLYLSKNLCETLANLHLVRNGELVFYRQNKQMVLYSSIRKSFVRFQKSAGVEPITFHGIRHTFASHFLEKSGSLFQLRALLGHSDIETTMKYSHMAEEYLQSTTGIVSFNPGKLA